ncbi:MAG: GNAT family N-acetyltransferase [Nitriliruptor sp.]|nr:MAG: GNAT family N-acetyltransferase [Nitriliruptor sp.]
MTGIRELPVGQTHLGHAAFAELRPPYADDVDRFVARVDTVQRPQGYRLLAAFDPDDTAAAAVAGFRFIANLAWGDILYIDDLSTRADFRRRGYGAGLLDAVAAEAGRLGCDAVHLDSGHQRYDAHRVYLASGYRITSHHFAHDLR